MVTIYTVLDVKALCIFFLIIERKFLIMVRRRRMLEDANSERKTMEFTNLLKSITDSLQGIQSCCDSLLGYCDNISEDFNEIMFDSNYPMSDRQLNRTLSSISSDL